MWQYRQGEFNYLVNFCQHFTDKNALIQSLTFNKEFKCMKHKSLSIFQKHTTAILTFYKVIFQKHKWIKVPFCKITNRTFIKFYKIKINKVNHIQCFLYWHQKLCDKNNLNQKWPFPHLTIVFKCEWSSLRLDLLLKN